MKEKKAQCGVRKGLIEKKNKTIPVDKVNCKKVVQKKAQFMDKENKTVTVDEVNGEKKKKNRKSLEIWLTQSPGNLREKTPCRQRIKCYCGKGEQYLKCSGAMSTEM